MPFRAGESGNKGGRPRSGTSLACIVRRTVDPEALVAALVKIATSTHEKTADRIAAIRMLSDRGWGAPVSSSIVMSMPNPALPPGWEAMSSEQRSAWLDAATLTLGEGNS